jgi:hypothetical protein
VRSFISISIARQQLDEPIPMLGDVSPRTAIRSKREREKVFLDQDTGKPHGACSVRRSNGGLRVRMAVGRTGDCRSQALTQDNQQPMLSLPKSRFERTDDVARQGSDAQQRLRTARSGVCRARLSRARHASAPRYIGIFRKDSSKLLRVERDQMIGALAPDRSDQAFSISVLPGRAERSGPVPDAHCSHPSAASWSLTRSFAAG